MFEEPSSNPTERIVLQKEPPRSDLQVDIKRAGDYTIVSFAGKISESFKGEDLGRRLVGNVILDTRQIDRITSFGVRAWLSMLQAMDVDNLYFARCSDAVINQMGMIRSFTGEGQITSFFAPYLCDGCGNPFTVLYDATSDAHAIREATPFDVPCPRCKNPSTLDEDPATFFNIGPLVTETTENLRSSLAKLAPLGQYADPIEKTIRDAVTVVKFNTSLDASLRLRRIFDGLEGVAKLDFGSVPDTTQRGLDNLLRALDHLEAEITSINIVGCPEPLAKAIADRTMDPRVHVLSVVVSALCRNPPAQRTVFVDLEQHGSVLATGAAPNLRCGWCDEGLSLNAALPVLTVLAKRLNPSLPNSATEASTSTSRLQIGMVVASILTIGGVAAVAATVLVGLVVFWMLAPAPSSSDWIAGKTPPPEWTETIWHADNEGIHVVAGADADDLESALAIAREEAIFKLVQHVADELTSTPIHTVLPKESGATFPQRRAIAKDYIAQTTPYGIPQREEVAIRKGGLKSRVFARYTLTTNGWAQVVHHYREQHTFRGVELARRFPTQQSDRQHGVQVVRTASWLAQPKAGARLLKVGTTPIYSFEDSVMELESQWAALPPGGVLELTFSTPTGSERVPFAKRSTP